jgi:hypothetical protein
MEMGETAAMKGAAATTLMRRGVPRLRTTLYLQVTATWGLRVLRWKRLAVGRRRCRFGIQQRRRMRTKMDLLVNVTAGGGRWVYQRVRCRFGIAAFSWAAERLPLWLRTCRAYLF